MKIIETQKKHPEQENHVVSKEATEKEIYQKLLEKKLSNLKSLNLDEAIVNVWITDVKPRNKAKRFNEIKRLQLHENAQKSFKKYVKNCISKNEHIAELKNISTNQDNRFFHVESAATDLSQLVTHIENDEISTINNKLELREFNSYAIQLTLPESKKNIFAFRYIKGSWAVKNSTSKKKFLNFKMLDNELVADIQEDFQFTVDPYIDFIQIDEDIFISNLKQFEVAMNYHERLKEKKGIAIESLCESCALSGTAKDPLTRIIGTDKFLMRQLASVHEKGFFKNQIWLTKLKKAAEGAGNWKIKFDDNGEIVVEENKEYIKELLILLQNKRVKTVVDGVMFDVDGELMEVDLVN